MKMVVADSVGDCVVVLERRLTNGTDDLLFVGDTPCGSGVSEVWISSADLLAAHTVQPTEAVRGTGGRQRGGLIHSGGVPNVLDEIWWGRLQ